VTVALGAPITIKIEFYDGTTSAASSVTEDGVLDPCAGRYRVYFKFNVGEEPEEWDGEDLDGWLEITGSQEAIGDETPCGVDDEDWDFVYDPGPPASTTGIPNSSEELAIYQAVNP
jgi:hypothetical protein